MADTPQKLRSDGTKAFVDFEVTIQPEDGRSMFDEAAFAALDTLDAFRAHKGRAVETARRLAADGFTIHHVGDFSISASGPSDRFEEFFRTRVEKQVKTAETPRGREVYEFHAPAKGTPFEVPAEGGFDRLIERAYIQQEPVFFGTERALPPIDTSGQWRLRVPGDIAQLMQAAEVHQTLGLTGNGVTVAMPDSGFFHHPFLKAQGYNFLAVTAPDARDHTSDPVGHGTGECANLFATAPGINFIGVKMKNPTLAFKTAVDLSPDIITNSWGYPEDNPGTSMPNYLKPLHLAVLDAVSRGITTCFSAGNGHRGFPGSMPEVISVGGAYINQDLTLMASDFASGYTSTWFPGRVIPDVCGLTGMKPAADYIVLPVEAGAKLETLAPGSGWGAFSGTSAASPMVAGVCALLKEADPSLTPEQIKSFLKFTARDVTQGTGALGEQAVPGPDTATGFGLVDAARAVSAAL